MNAFVVSAVRRSILPGAAATVGGAPPSAHVPERLQLEPLTPDFAFIKDPLLRRCYGCGTEKQKKAC